MLKFIILILFSFSYSQDVIGEGLTGQSLLDYVVSNYKTNTTLGYTNARDVLYGTIDIKEEDQLSCVYSGYTITLDTTQDPSTNAYEQGINCEHTWPQSMGASDEPQKSDMHHLYPCKDNVNSSRGNHPYAESTDTDTDTWYRNDYSQTSIPTEFIDEYAEKNNGNYQSFEPREDHKGDASRSMFYFFAMYQSVSDTNFWNTQKETLLNWHYYDQVDQRELDRTWEIASYQENNPNPFVLDSSLARRIWYLDDGGFDTTVTDTISYNIIINEIMQNPAAVSDEVGEWFEIFNNSNEIINLNGFIIRDEGSDSHTINQEFNLDPFSFAVLGRNSNQEVNGGVSIAYEYTGIALANGADEILLIDPLGFTVDSIAYDGGSSWPDPTGASMALIDINSENEQSENWVEYDSLTYGDGDYGTPGELNFPLDIEWDFTLSEPIITVFGDDNEWNPVDTISIKMELCNNSDYSHGYYPGAILEADSNLVTIMNENWFYGMNANTCDSVFWNVIASNIEVSTPVDFIAYPTILNCDNNPEFCFQGDTISFSININAEQSFDCTADDGTEGVELWGACYSIENTDSLHLEDTETISLDGSIPPEIGNLTNLTYLELEGELTGVIPPEIGNLTNLAYLDLGYNDLEGSIPPEIGNLTNLTHLYLEENSFTDSIPSEIGNLISLTELMLYTNQLTGSIPSEIGNLTNLVILGLVENQLTGEIPESFESLSQLTMFGLSENYLSGNIPEFICNIFSNCELFDISSNSFCPPYPSCILGEVGEQDTTNCEQVSIIDGTLPVTYKLYNAYPNPFNPFTIISYDLPENTYVNLKIYDISGRVIRNLIDEFQNPGRKKVKWDGSNEQGRIMSAGVYLYTINRDGLIQTEKVILLK